MLNTYYILHDLSLVESTDAEPWIQRADTKVIYGFFFSAPKGQPHNPYVLQGSTVHSVGYYSNSFDMWYNIGEL